MTIIEASIASLVVIAVGARIIWRRGSRTTASNPLERAEHDTRLHHHLETAVDTIAIEVERISKAQRFVVALLAESNQLKRGERAGAEELPLPSTRTPGQTNTPH